MPDSPSEIPVYRPEITLMRRAVDGQWESSPTLTNTLFYPMPDEDGSRLTEAGFRRVVADGTEPFFRILIPEGASIVVRGTGTFLRLADGKVYDAITSLAYAKMREKGLDLVRPGREPARVAPAPMPAVAEDLVSRQGLLFDLVEVGGGVADA